MSQQTNITFRVSGDESGQQGMSMSLEEYLKSDENLIDRLQKGQTAPMNRLLKLKEQLDKLSGMVASGQSNSAQARRN